VLRLDYVSCALTVLSTILVGRKLWTGLVVAAVNSLIFCLIGLRTAQFGFIPANLFCIAVYGLSLRSWLREGQRKTLEQNREAARPVQLREESACPSDAAVDDAVFAGTSTAGLR
jgi:hypothetical protein